MSSTNQYFKVLLEFLYSVQNCSYNEKNEIWLNRYLKYKTDINESRLDCLPSILTLIYPDFLYDKDGRYIGDIIDFDSTNFKESINDSDNCQINHIEQNMICEFNDYRNLRKKCQADHYWPHSLGGPTILENRILLCRFHNLAKSNSIMNSFWASYPTWLNNYVNRMANLKK